jgi:hyperosmotically inducible periplasmic protein
MNPIQRKGVALVASLAVLLGLAACNRADDRTASQRLDAGSAKRAGADARREAKGASASAAAPSHSAADSASAASPSGNSTSAMGAPAGDKVDDAAITAKVNASLARDKDLSAIRIDVDTQNGVVTLSGLAPSASAKEHASEIAHKVPGVHSVNNQLTIASS